MVFGVLPNYPSTSRSRETKHYPLTPADNRLVTHDDEGSRDLRAGQRSRKAISSSGRMNPLYFRVDPSCRGVEPQAPPWPGRKPSYIETNHKYPEVDQQDLIMTSVYVAHHRYSVAEPENVRSVEQCLKEDQRSERLTVDIIREDIKASQKPNARGRSLKSATRCLCCGFSWLYRY